MESQQFKPQAIREAVSQTWERLGLSQAEPQPDHRCFICLFFSLYALQRDHESQPEQQPGQRSPMALALPSYDQLANAAQALRQSSDSRLLSLQELQDLAEWAVCTAEWQRRSRLIIFAAALVLVVMLASSGLLLVLPGGMPGIAVLPTLVFGPIAGLLLVTGMDSGPQPVVRRTRPSPVTSSRPSRSHKSAAGAAPGSPRHLCRPHTPSPIRAAPPAGPKETAPAPAPDPFARVMQAAEPLLAAGLTYLLTRASQLQEHISHYYLLGSTDCSSSAQLIARTMGIIAPEPEQHPDAAALGRARLVTQVLDMAPCPDAERYVRELLGVLTGDELNAAQQDEQAASKECERPEVQMELLPDSTRLSKLLRSGTPTTTSNNVDTVPPLHVVIHDAFRRMNTEGTTVMSGASHLAVLEPPGTPFSHTQRHTCVPQTLGGSSTNGRKSRSSEVARSLDRPLCSATEYPGGVQAPATGVKLLHEHQHQQRPSLQHVEELPETPAPAAAAPSGPEQGGAPDTVHGKEEVVAKLYVTGSHPFNPLGKPSKPAPVVAPDSHKLSRSAMKAVAKARQAAAEQAMQAGLKTAADGQQQLHLPGGSSSGELGLAGALRRLTKGEKQQQQVGGDVSHTQQPPAGPCGSVERPKLKDVQNRMGDPVLVYAGNPNCRIGLEEDDEEEEQKQQRPDAGHIQQVSATAKQAGVSSHAAIQGGKGCSDGNNSRSLALSKVQHKLSSKLRKLFRPGGRQ